MQSRHSKLYCLCSRDIQNFVCAVATFKTLLFVQSRHSKLYCLCSRDIQNFIVCAVETFETLLFVQLRHSKLYCLCSRAIRNFLVCVSLLGLRMDVTFKKNQKKKSQTRLAAMDYLDRKRCSRNFLHSTMTNFVLPVTLSSATFSD